MKNDTCDHFNSIWDDNHSINCIQSVAKPIVEESDSFRCRPISICKEGKYKCSINEIVQYLE